MAPTPLKDLLIKERHLHARLDSLMVSSSMKDTDIEALGLQYEECLLQILDYIARNPKEVIQKFEFVFNVLKRGYEDHRLLAFMKTSLMADIMNLYPNSDFG